MSFVVGGTVTLCLIVASLGGLEAHSGSWVGVRGAGVVVVGVVVDVVMGVVGCGLLGGGTAVGVRWPRLVGVHATVLVGCPVTSILELHWGLGCMLAALCWGDMVGHVWVGLCVEVLLRFFVGFFFLLLWCLVGLGSWGCSRWALLLAFQGLQPLCQVLVD